MMVTAFIVGFFTALGWWSANKITDKIDNADKPIIEKKVEENV